MNHYLVNLNIDANGYESTAIHLIKATHSDKAIQLAYFEQAHGDLESYKTGAECIVTGEVYTIHSCKLVNPIDLSTLKAYLQV
jgi:hypothetical protein